MPFWKLSDGLQVHRIVAWSSVCVLEAQPWAADSVLVMPCPWSLQSVDCALEMAGTGETVVNVDKAPFHHLHLVANARGKNQTLQGPACTGAAATKYSMRCSIGRTFLGYSVR